MCCNKNVYIVLAMDLVDVANSRASRMQWNITGPEFWKKEAGETSLQFCLQKHRMVVGNSKHDDLNDSELL